MRHNFNLVDEKWIPCITGSGKLEEFGLKEVLVRAHDLREIFDLSPLVVVSLHRLLLAILHRIFGPETMDRWKELWRQGKWNEKILAEYFATWYQRFDLFSEERPFFQDSSIQQEKAGPIQRLAQEAASLHNPTLFDHSHEGDGVSYPPGVAARYLIASQAFALQGGVSKPFNFSNAPLVSGYTVLVLGDSLFETLALNLVPYNREVPIPWGREGDRPWWEQESRKEPEKGGTSPSGYLDYLTWQSRRIQLVPEENALNVKECRMLQNLAIPKTWTERDPFKCYEQSGKGKKGPVIARNIRPDRALWRDSHALFQEAGSDRAEYRPLVLDHLARVKHWKVVDQTRLMISGLAANQAKVDLWRQERFPLPLEYLVNRPLLGKLKQGITKAEEVHNSVLWPAVARAAKLVLDPHAEDQGAAQPDKKKINAMVDHLAPGEAYWPKLESHFRTFLVNLADEFQASSTREGALAHWARTLRRAAQEAFDSCILGLELSPRTLKALARVEGWFRGALNGVLKDFEGGDQ